MRLPSRSPIVCACLAIVVCVQIAAIAHAQATKPSVYIVPADNFETYMSAAIIKKQVPVRVVALEDNADYVLRAKPVEEHHESTGSKWAKCLFAYCAGTEDSANVSVELMKGEEIVWSYAVNKQRGQKNRQSLAEAIAVHMKDEYFSKHH